jgi:hypothetical protein
LWALLPLSQHKNDALLWTFHFSRLYLQASKTDMDTFWPLYDDDVGFYRGLVDDDEKNDEKKFKKFLKSQKLAKL